MQKHEEYAINEMLSMFPGLRSFTLSRYLTKAEQVCTSTGRSFDAIRALDDLSKTIKTLKGEITRRNN